MSFYLAERRYPPVATRPLGVIGLKGAVACGGKKRSVEGRGTGSAARFKVVPGDKEKVNEQLRKSKKSAR